MDDNTWEHTEGDSQFAPRGRIRHKYTRTAKGWSFEDSIEISWPLLSETSDEEAQERHNEIVYRSRERGLAEVATRNQIEAGG